MIDFVTRQERTTRKIAFAGSLTQGIVFGVLAGIGLNNLYSGLFAAIIITLMSYPVMLDELKDC